MNARQHSKCKQHSDTFTPTHTHTYTLKGTNSPIKLRGQTSTITHSQESVSLCSPAESLFPEYQSERSSLQECHFTATLKTKLDGICLGSSVYPFLILSWFFWMPKQLQQYSPLTGGLNWRLELKNHNCAQFLSLFYLDGCRVLIPWPEKYIRVITWTNCCGGQQITVVLYTRQLLRKSSGLEIFQVDRWNLWPSLNL